MQRTIHGSNPDRAGRISSHTRSAPPGPVCVCGNGHPLVAATAHEQAVECRGPDSTASVFTERLNCFKWQTSAFIFQLHRAPTNAVQTAAVRSRPDVAFI